MVTTWSAGFDAPIVGSFGGFLGGRTVHAQDATTASPSDPLDEEAIEKGLLLYADAANLQNGGALQPAIETWRTFMDRYPTHPRYGDAAHYLGVCLMQIDPPQPADAAAAFEKAIAKPNDSLREKSLANLGWCLYSAGVAETPADEKSLNRSIEIFGMLVDDYPESEFLDRAHFYRGEAAYTLRRYEEAVQHYDRLLTLPDIASSQYRCDGYYARGVALETTGQTDRAIASYRQFIESCGDQSPLQTEVQSRLADLLVATEDYAGAIETFGDVVDSADDAEAAYALWRRGYARFAIDKISEAVSDYEALLERYPDSEYAAAARMSSAGAAFRDGQTDLASRRFREVLEADDLVAATEAAHWLCRIEIAADNFAAAESIASRQLDRIQAIDGDEPRYAPEIRFDLAQSVASDSGRVGESVAIFVAAADGRPDSALAARAIYNAAFSAVAAGQASLALELCDRFDGKFPEHELGGDVELVRVEALLKNDRPGDAADVLLRRIAASDPTDQSRRDDWILRAATALSQAERPSEAIELLQSNLPSMSTASRSAGQFALGRLLLSDNQHKAAADAFEQVRQLDPDGELADESLLLQAASRQRAGQVDAAESLYRETLRRDPSTAFAGEAKFRLAGIVADKEQADTDEWQQAETLYAEVIAADANPRLIPFAMIARGDVLSRMDRWEDAAAQLTDLLDRFPDHPVAARARYDRGVARSMAGQSEAAREDLRQFIDSQTDSELLPDALYELALLQQTADDHQAAAETFRRLIDSDESFPERDDAVYRLGWSLWKSEQYDAARENFERLSERADGDYRFDASAMIGETFFEQQKYEPALAAFASAREILRGNDDRAASIRDRELSRTRELVLLHGGQSAAQLQRFDEAIEWYDELRDRFPATSFLPELFYELGSASRELGQTEAALKYFGEVVDNYRNEIAARARFMRGEIYFGERQFNEAIGEFQRLMFGFGSDRAPESIRPWQARAGFEAGRCSELLASTAASDSARDKAIEIAVRFYRYVTEKHPGHELADKAKQRLEALQT